MHRVLRGMLKGQEGGNIRPAFALRRAFQGGYGWRDFRADLSAGFVVGIIALPLSMALAIATGLPPQHGLFTAPTSSRFAASSPLPTLHTAFRRHCPSSNCHGVYRCPTEV